MEAFVMVGAPGSGKSTFAARTFPHAVTVSSDTIREKLYGNAEIQGNWGEIQAEMTRLIQECAIAGKDVVVDATHYRKQYRDASQELLKEQGYERITAVVVNKSLDTCLRQNSSRERKVPTEVIQNMHKSLQESLKNIYNEGFYRIEFIY